jgi:peroxiredoxin
MPDLLAVGTEAPPFTLQTLEGKTYSLKEFQGKKMVLIEFFSTGCPHCHASVPFLQFIAENFSDTVQLLAINSADQPGQPSTTPEFRDHYKTRFPILEIPNQELLTNYHLRGFPTSYLIDTDGKIIWVHEGVYSNVTMIQLEKALYPNEKPEAFAKATTEAPHPAKN